jgi:hypothetical protein
MRAIFSGVKFCQNGGGVGKADARGLAWCCSAIVELMFVRMLGKLKSDN